MLIEPTYADNDSVMLRQTALASIGITILPAKNVSADLAQGALVRGLNEWEICDTDRELSLVYPGHGHVRAKTRSLVNFIVEWLCKRETETRIEMQGESATQDKSPAIIRTSGNS